MTITITDPKLLEKLCALAAGSVEVQTPGGAKLGRFIVEREGMLSPGSKVSFTEEEIAGFRMDRGPGRPLTDIIRDLKAKFGE